MTDNLSKLSALEQKELLVDLLSQRPKRVFPLSLAQQRLWFLDRLHPGNPVYNVPFGLRLRGNLNRRALELGVRGLIQRHEILRTNFETDADRPVQVAVADFAIEIPFIDLVAISSSDRQLEVHRIGMQEARFPFNLAVGPLLRFKLIRVSTDEHLFLCVMHHIVCDGWSLEILARELAAFYAEYSGGPSAALSDLPLQYGDYAQWQHEWIAGDILAGQAQYWKRKLAGAPAFLHLPADRVRPIEQSYEGAHHVIAIPKKLIDGLVDFGRTQRATLFMVMLTAFKTLLHCYTGAKDILVGVPVAGRNRIELEDLVGFFVNMLAMRVDFSGDPHFDELLLQVREVALEAFANADLPFEKLVADLNPERTLSYSPVIQVMFSAVKVRKLPNFGNVLVSPYIFNSCTSLFDLSVEFIEEAEDYWWLRVGYATSLFDYARMAKMMDDYLRLLRTVVAQPELRISTLVSLLRTNGDVTVRNGNILSDRATNLTALRVPDCHSKDKAEPGDALEQILVRIWERMLGTPGIRVNENFFDLGGHSLLAAQLVSEAEKAIGRAIPLSALFRGSTIESFAELIRSGTESSPDPLVMVLNAGTQGSPLFAIVQSGWDALGYALLARHIGSERPFYKLQANTHVHNIPLSSEDLRTVAREYVAAMRAVQPKGPYFLVGMCYGVHIAEQMVLELESQNHEVGYLGIIDTFVLEHSHIRWLEQLEGFRRGRQNVSRLPLLAQALHYKQVIKKRLQQFLLHETEPASSWAKAFWPGKEFRPKQFSAPVLLFRKPKQPYFKIRDREMGWGARSLSGVKICTVNGTAHEEMLREPAVGVIAAQLSNTLRRMERGDSFHACFREPESIST